jgi:toxin-antitoxin system PIN domain toxin
LKLPDSNIWIALAIPEHVSHALAYQWFAAQKDRKSVLFCRSTQQSFLRLLTTDQLLRPYNIPPLTNIAAWKVVEDLLQNPVVDFSPEPSGIDVHWKILASRNSPSPKLWMDAYLAAFAIAGNHQLVTADKSFAQFPRLNSLILS